MDARPNPAWRIVGSSLLPVVSAPPHPARDQQWLDALSSMPTVFFGTTFAKASGLSVHDATHVLARLATPGHVFALGGRSGAHINLTRDPGAGWNELQVAISTASHGPMSCGCHTLYGVAHLPPGTEMPHGATRVHANPSSDPVSLKEIQVGAPTLLMQALAATPRRLLVGPGSTPFQMRGFQSVTRPQAWLDRMRKPDAMTQPPAGPPVLVAASTSTGTALRSLSLPIATPGASLADLYMYGESSDLVHLAQALECLGARVELPYQASTGDRLRVLGVLGDKEGRQAPAGGLPEVAGRQPICALVKPKAFAAALSEHLSDDDRITFESCVAFAETIASPRFAPRYRAA
ncbi:MAG: hypothetical protein O9327_03205 [Polaromonas sp.]|nr:hypothetical protein [Polaromonas sp.]